MNIELDLPARIKRHKQFQSDLVSFIRSRALLFTDDLSHGEKVAVLTDGLDTWQALLAKHYPHTLPNDYTGILRKDEFVQIGFQSYPNALAPSICEQAISDFRRSEDRSCSYLLDCHSPATLAIFSAIDNFLSSHYSSFLIANNLNLLPWRMFYYQLQRDSVSLSNKWHYDLEVPKNCFFVMVYLNNAPCSGTMVYDHLSSTTISSAHGYISSPPDYRATGLDFYHSLDGVRPPMELASKAGSILAFFPSLCLHKGFFHSDGGDESPRHVLHLSFVLVPSAVEVPDKYCFEDLAAASLDLPKSRSFAPFIID